MMGDQWISNVGIRAQAGVSATVLLPRATLATYPPGGTGSGDSPPVGRAWLATADQLTGEAFLECAGDLRIRRYPARKNFR